MPVDLSFLPEDARRHAEKLGERAAAFSAAAEKAAAPVAKAAQRAAEKATAKMEDRAAALVHDKVAPAVLEFLVEVYAKHIKRALLTDKRMPDSIFRLAHDIADELWRNALLEIKPRIDQLVESIIQGRRTERQPAGGPRAAAQQREQHGSAHGAQGLNTRTLCRFT